MGRVGRPGSPDEAILIAAIMKSAGKSELFVPMELLEDMPEGATLTFFHDFPRDGYVLRLHERGEVIEGEEVHERKEIEG